MLKQKIKSLKDRLKVWNRDQFGDALRKYKRIEEDLNKMEEESVVSQKQMQQDLGGAAQAHESLLR